MIKFKILITPFKMDFRILKFIFIVTKAALRMLKIDGSGMASRQLKALNDLLNEQSDLG